MVKHSTIDGQERGEWNGGVFYRNKENKGSDSNEGAGGLMDMDTRYAHSEESGDKPRGESRQPSPGGSNNIPAGFAANNRFDDFADAYINEPPAKWPGDDHSHGASSNGDGGDQLKDHELLSLLLS